MTQARDPRPETADRGGDVRVGVYVRRSTDDEHQPYSIEAQDARLASYIGSQPGWRQAARFADDASGATTARPGLRRALAAARAGMIDVLLVYRVDRLTRSLRDLVTLLDDLDHAGVAFRSATEPFDTATAIGRMLVQMLGMFAQFERDTIIDRVIAGMERKAAAGKWKGGRRPFGYRADVAASSLVPDPGEAAVVRLIFGTYIRDRLGARAIANTLSDRGHRTTTGSQWSAHQVLRVLANRIHLGELSFRGITCAGCHSPLIEQTTFDEAQRILAARGEDHAKRAASGSDYLLTGLIRCPACGSAMIGTRAHGKTKDLPVLLLLPANPIRHHRLWRPADRRRRHRGCRHRRTGRFLPAPAPPDRRRGHQGAGAARRRSRLPARRTCRHRPRVGQNRRGDRAVPSRIRKRRPRPRGLRRPPRPAQRQDPTTHRPPGRTRRPARCGTRDAAARHAARDRWSHRPDHRRWKPQPAEGPHRGPGRPGQDHWAQPHRSRVPHPAGHRQNRSRWQRRRVRCSCNDQFGQGLHIWL